MAGFSSELPYAMRRSEAPQVDNLKQKFAEQFGGQNWPGFVVCSLTMYVCMYCVFYNCC
jgi:hypothetical protein